MSLKMRRDGPTTIEFAIPPGRDSLKGSRRMWSGGIYTVVYPSKEAADEHERLLTTHSEVLVERIPGGAVPQWPVDTILVMVIVSPSEPHTEWIDEEGARSVRLVAEITESLFPMGASGSGKTN